MIEYTNISYEEYLDLPREARKRNSYCIEYLLEKCKDWKINGELHREDGPAVEYDDGINFWYLNNIEYSFEDWCEKLNKTDEEIIFLRLKYS